MWLPAYRKLCDEPAVPCGVVNLPHLLNPWPQLTGHNGGVLAVDVVIDGIMDVDVLALRSVRRWVRCWENGWVKSVREVWGMWEGGGVIGVESFCIHTISHCITPYHSLHSAPSVLFLSSSSPHTQICWQSVSPLTHASWSQWPCRSLCDLLQHCIQQEVSFVRGRETKTCNTWLHTGLRRHVANTVCCSSVSCCIIQYVICLYVKMYNMM